VTRADCDHGRVVRLNEIVSRRVMDELEATGYEPRLHRPDTDGPFEVVVPGHGFDIGDLKAMVQMAEATGTSLALDERGRITLR
jgi:hypothetical protein